VPSLASTAKKYGTGPHTNANRRRGNTTSGTGRYAPPQDEVGCLSDSLLKGFFHQSDARLAPPVPESQRIVSGTFYGYPAELVAEICGVSLKTAARWKSGEVTLSRPALRLFDLHRRRKVLASPSWEGWLVNGDALVDPEGNATTQAQLRAYYLVCQLATELAHDSPEALERLEDIRRQV
jgi:hypothetical protein